VKHDLPDGVSAFNRMGRGGYRIHSAQGFFQRRPVPGRRRLKPASEVSSSALCRSFPAVYYKVGRGGVHATSKESLAGLKSRI
jgi:hypothetical protein